MKDLEYKKMADFIEDDKAEEVRSAIEAVIAEAQDKINLIAKKAVTESRTDIYYSGCAYEKFLEFQMFNDKCKLIVEVPTVKISE